MYCSEKNYRVEVCFLHLSGTIRFQARHVKAVPSAMKATLITQSEN